MKFEINHKVMEGEAYSVAYPNDLLDGVLLDLDESYLFLSDHIEEHRLVQEKIGEMQFFDMADMEIDIDKAPHSWVVRSVGKLIINEAESLLG